MFVEDVSIKNSNFVVIYHELTKKGKVKRMYTMLIDDFSTKSLRKIFEKHIDTSAKITTDLWKGYISIENDYDIT